MRFERVIIIMLGMLVLSGCTGPHSKNYLKRGLKAGRGEPVQIGLEDIDDVTDQDLSLFADQPAISDSSAEVKSDKRHAIRGKANSTNGGVYEISPMSTINVAISNKGYTRFSMEDERIEDVFVFPQEELQVSIQKQGYLLVLPRVATMAVTSSVPVKAQDIYMTITGDEGTTQDIVLRLTGKAPQPVKFVK